MLNWLRKKFRKSRVYFTSDWHFYHKKIIEYCNRPFKDVDEMTEHMIKTWNNTIGPNDIVYFLGDFSLNPNWSKRLLGKLNGYKILVSGNHDGCHISNKKSAKMKEKYLNDWNEVYEADHWIKLKNGLTVQLCHLPFAPKENEDLDVRYLEFRPKDIGQYLLCGHLHGRFIKKGRMIDVGYDAHEGQILSEDDVIELINDKRDFIKSHLTDSHKDNGRNKKEENY